MYNYFTNDCLSVSLRRNSDNTLSLSIGSDYGNGRFHKSQLHVCEKRLAQSLEELWKAVKSKKLQSVFVGFSECDYYDNMTDMYDTPNAYMKRGKRKAEIGSSEHGCIPKDWSINLSATILDTTTINPILEVVKNALGFSKFKAMEKELVKRLRPVLQKKEGYAKYYLESDED
jgi:hypothetical protein